jgi:hypothetical protein
VDGDVPSGGAGRNPLKITILKDTSLTVRFEAGRATGGLDDPLMTIRPGFGDSDSEERMRLHF